MEDLWYKLVGFLFLTGAIAGAGMVALAWLAAWLLSLL